MTTRVLDDLGNALLMLRRAFELHGMSQPTAIELSTDDDAETLLRFVEDEYARVGRRYQRDSNHIVATLGGIDFVRPGTIKEPDDA